MTRPFSANVWREDHWYVAQCLEIDIASQGSTEEEAFANLKEAIELHFELPVASEVMEMGAAPLHPEASRTIEVEVGSD